MKKLTLIILLFLTSITWAQNYKFGKVSKAELEESFYPLDSTANAAVLYSERKSSFEYSYDRGFYIVEKYFTRLKIYNKEGFENATNKILAYHGSNGDENVSGLKAITYNLENGKIEKTKLEKKNVFKEEKNKYYDYYKFTLPNIKPGSVLEWRYTFESPYIAMFNEVILQHDIPIKKILVRIATPEYLVYNTKMKGYLPIPLEKDRKSRTIAYNYHNAFNNGYQGTSGKSEINFEEYIHKIEKINVPAIKDEPYSGNLNNYKSGVLYELSFTKFPNSTTNPYAKTWKNIVEDLYKSSSFGGQLKKSNHFKNDLAEVLEGTVSINEKIMATYQFVKKKIKWNGYNSKYSFDGIKKTYTEGVGNTADINLNLIAMLKSVGFDTSPVLVSTIDNGIPLFPTKNGFNYVIAKVETPSGYMLLDATEKNALPNILPKRVLNFRGLIVKDTGESEWVELFPKKHSIIKTTLNAKFNELGFNGTARKTITNNFLFNYRNAARGKSDDTLIEWIDEKTEGVEVINARVTNLDKLEKDAIETIQFETELFYEEIANKTYISPLLYLQTTENPFKSEKRDFPVFYNKPWATMSIVNISIPQNYTIETIPESVEFTLPNEMGIFSYDIISHGQQIQIKSTFVITIPVISTNHYQDLKEFYKKVIAKQNEKIVLIKK